jgi:hypothetical protein
MSVFAVVGVVLAVAAGLINIVTGLLRRKHAMLAAMRFGLGLLSLIAAAAIIVFKSANDTLAQFNVTGTMKYVYLIMALAIFVGVTLMLPATVERNNLPPEDRFQPSVRPATVTGPAPQVANEGGVHVAKEDDKWVN